MHLNYDCLREVLLSIERNLNFDHSGYDITFHELYICDLMTDPKVARYSVEDVFYAVYNLYQAEYINASIISEGKMAENCAVLDITYEGHMFLRTIADDTVWKTVKKAFGPVIQASLPIVQEVATKYILNRLGLQG